MANLNFTEIVPLTYLKTPFLVKGSYLMVLFFFLLVNQTPFVKFDKIIFFPFGLFLEKQKCPFFIDALENKIMTKLKSLGVKVWFRFVDDTFVVISGKERVEEVMNFLIGDQNWNSLTDRKYKIGLIYCLLDRIWKICSDKKDRELVEKLKAILAKNDYSSEIIKKETEKFLKKPYE